MGAFISFFDNFVFPPTIVEGEIEYFDCYEPEEFPEEIYFDSFPSLILQNWPNTETVINGDTLTFSVHSHSSRRSIKQKVARFFKQFKKE